MVTGMGRSSSWMRHSLERRGIVIKSTRRYYLILGFLFAAILLFCVYWHSLSVYQKYQNFRHFDAHDAIAGHSDPLHASKFTLIADLDKGSYVEAADGHRYRSVEKIGLLEVSREGLYSIRWLNEFPVFGTIAAEGRGMELSELLYFNGNLLSFDDRTGVVYKHGDDGVVIPLYIISEGEGMTGNGMKIEWATVKDNVMWIGGFGREYTTTDGLEILHYHHLWVVSIDEAGHMKRYNWKAVYDKIRGAVGAEFPGYIIHEAVAWSHFHRRWFFLPRRVSTEGYHELLDEKRGSNLLISLSEDFDDISIVKVGDIIPTRGFSSFKFIPGSHDEKILAVKTEEDSLAGTQNSYLTVFTRNGTVLMHDTEIPGGYKFEGVEFDYQTSL